MLDKAEQENRSLNDAENVDFEKLKDLVKQLSDEIARYETVADEERNIADKGKPVETRGKTFSNDELRHYIKNGVNYEIFPPPVKKMAVIPWSHNWIKT